MTLLQRAVIIWIAASVLVLVLEVASRSRPLAVVSAKKGVIPACLGTIAVALLVVGVVSDTLLIHVVQILPLVAALLLAVRKPSWGIDAAVSLFAFWVVVMGGIWLFLLGISRFLTGRFSPAEIILTILIGVASIAGLAAAYRAPRAASLATRLGMVVFVGGIQAAALWLSYSPLVLRR